MGIETLAAISIAAGVAGAGIGAYGAYAKGKAGSETYTYQAAVAQNNQAIAKRNAQYQLAAGESEAEIAGIKERQQMGATKAGQSARGLDVNTGSNADIQEGEAKIASFEQMMIRHNAARKAYGAELEGYQQGVQSTLDLKAAKQARTAGDIDIASSLVGGASSVSDKWFKFSQAGAFA